MTPKAFQIACAEYLRQAVNRDERWCLSVPGTSPGLEDCPVCGSSYVLNVRTPDGWLFSCGTCDYDGPEHSTEDVAREAWNDEP